MLPAFAACTVLIAQAIGARGTTWATGALQTTPPVVTVGTLRTAMALRRLHAMQRPRVARAWAEAAVKTGLANDRAACNLLVAACRLLDTPPPMALLRELPREASVRS